MSRDFTFEAPPRPLAGKRIKAGFHCHTVHSDGGLSTADTIKRYREKGFHCLGITDHRKVTLPEEGTGSDFLFLGSTENGGDPDIIGVGVQAPVAIELPLAQRAAQLAAQGGFTIAAHPTFCAVMPEEYLACPDIMALEIFNAYCDHAYGNGGATELWDMLLGQGRRIWGVAGDDAHLNPRKKVYSDAGRGWVEIWAAGPEREEVLAALKQGAFFSTRGPSIEAIRVSDTGIAIECSPVKQVRWRTYGRRGHLAGWVRRAPEGETITGDRLPEHLLVERYVRAELVDENGRRAWSNPVFVRGL